MAIDKNPDGCCGTKVCCGNGKIKDVLVATIMSVSGCGCATGATILLPYVLGSAAAGSAIWRGSGTFGTCPGNRTVTLEILCVGNADCAFKLTLSISGCLASFVQNAPNSCVCGENQPLNATYSNIPVPMCCSPMMPPPAQTISLTITD